jgi:hypothetical protein
MFESIADESELVQVVVRLQLQLQSGEVDVNPSLKSFEAS